MGDALTSLLTEFCAITGQSVELPDDFRAALTRLCEHLDRRKVRPAKERRRWLIARINAKFRCNSEAIAALYARAAADGVTFNYHQKTAIQNAFDLVDRKAFERVLAAASVSPALRRALRTLFKPVSESQSLACFAHEIEDPSKLRREKGDRPIGREIVLAALAAFAFSYAEERVVHEHFDRTFDAATYETSFWIQLRRMYPQLYNRERTLDILRICQRDAARFATYEELRDAALAFVRHSYAALNNHGHLALWIEPLVVGRRRVAWELASDVMLFGEKHDEVPLRRTYFRHAQVAAQTAAHVPGISTDAARFEIANEGFTYRDTFVCSPTPDAGFGAETLLVLMQKNQRDETLIPCPACRSHDVQGNSYPSLGVRSWECCNLLCPDRSKYNRGKRYSFKALLMQEAIDDELNAIPTESVRGWARDVQLGRGLRDAAEMLIRHYSLHGDGVHLFGVDEPVEPCGRRLHHRAVALARPPAAEGGFFSSCWFQRYVVDAPRERPAPSVPGPASARVGQLTLVHGDAAEVLASLAPASFDGAVTSPPYYNAREYAQWDNIYCHLYDMLTIARRCFRALKPGAFYLYNIFDYFDNERSVVFSAMGDKRLILSAYTVDIFRRAGFVLCGSVTWDKGDIEGKRGFNAGNFSPYYQAPFNCWEHVLVFGKPPFGRAAEAALARLPAVLRAPPVLKMVNGENTHGHTAPFPDEIPRLLRPLVPAGAKVLDPFGGSGTTARALAEDCDEIVCVERSAEYCELARRLFEEAYSPNVVKRSRPKASSAQIALFDRGAAE